MSSLLPIALRSILLNYAMDLMGHTDIALTRNIFNGVARYFSIMI
ncbi:MAG: hypothetical protein ABFD04_03620 [Syntrophomonas sp.]